MKKLIDHKENIFTNIWSVTINLEDEIDSKDNIDINTEDNNVSILNKYYSTPTKSGSSNDGELVHVDYYDPPNWTIL